MRRIPFIEFASNRFGKLEGSYIVGDTLCTKGHGYDSIATLSYCRSRDINPFSNIQGVANAPRLRLGGHDPTPSAPLQRPVGSE